MMDETGAVEEDVNRPDLARERLDRFVRAHIELALISLEAGEATDVHVRRDDPRALAGKGLGPGEPTRSESRRDPPRALAAKALGRRAAYARPRRGQQRPLPRQSSRHE